LIDMKTVDKFTLQLQCYTDDYLLYADSSLIRE